VYVRCTFMWSSYSYSRGNNSQATNSVVATCQLFVFAPLKQFSPSARRGMRCMWILGTGSRAPWDTRMEVLAGGHMDTVASDLTFPRDVGCRLFAQCPGAGAGAWTGLATLEGQVVGGWWHGALALTSEVMDSLPVSLLLSMRTHTFRHPQICGTKDWRRRRLCYFDFMAQWLRLRLH